MIAFEKVTGDHTGANLATIIKEILDKYNLTFKLSKIICDSASDNISMASKLHELIWRDINMGMNRPELVRLVRFKGASSVIHCGSQFVHNTVKSLIEKLNLTAKCSERTDDTSISESPDFEQEDALDEIPDTLPNESANDLFDFSRLSSNIDNYTSLEQVLEEPSTDEPNQLRLNAMLSLDHLRSFIQVISTDNHLKEYWKTEIRIYNKKLPSNTECKLPEKFLQLDCGTRWNSLNSMVVDAIRYKPIIREITAKFLQRRKWDEKFITVYSDESNPKKPIISNIDWHVIATLKEALSPFELLIRSTSSADKCISFGLGIFTVVQRQL